MKRAFFLTYMFPPLGAVSAQRGAKFAKYLPSMGWVPTVFHAGRGHMFSHDPSLLAELPSVVGRVPVRTYEGAAVFKTLNKLGLGAITYRAMRGVPLDPQMGWALAVIGAVLREVRAQGKPDVLFSSSAPYSVNLAGLYLQTKLGVPWVADFRDEWTRNPHVRFVTPLHAKLARHYEVATMQAADAVTTVTPTWVAQFQSDRDPRKRPVDLVENGYDEADFREPPRGPAITDKWTLAIVGSVYEATSPRLLLEALSDLIAAGQIDGRYVRVVHAGNGKVKWPPANFEKRSLGFLSHAEAIGWMRRAHRLVLTASAQPRST